MAKSAAKRAAVIQGTSMPMSCVQGGSSTEIVQLRIRCTSFIGASIVWIVLPVAASAASFDCSQAKTAMEEVVCSEPSLSKADGDLATAYEILLDKLSPEGRRAMTEFSAVGCIKLDPSARRRKSQ